LLAGGELQSIWETTMEPAFDTLQTIGQLRDSGMPSEQAEATAKAISNMASTLVTKEYLKSGLDGLRIEVKQQFMEMGQRFTGQFMEMDQRFTGQLTEMDQRFTAQFTKVDERLMAMGQQFTGRFMEMDQRFTKRFAKVDQQFIEVKQQAMETDQRLTKRLNKVNARIKAMNSSVDARFKTMDASMKKRFASQTVLMVIIQTALLGAMFAALLHFS